MENSHYKFNISLREGVPTYVLDVSISDEFYGYAKNLKLSGQISHSRFEEFAHEMRRRVGFEDELFGDMEMCHWVRNEMEEDTGLLHHIRVPGSSAQSLALEKGLDGWHYHSHNLDTNEQFLILLSTIAHYVSSVEERLFYENIKSQSF